MAKVFIPIAIVLTIFTAILGFMTKTKVDDLQGTLKSTKNTLTTTQSNLAKTTSELKKTTEDLQAANKKSEEQQMQIGTLTMERDDAKMKVADLTTQMETSAKDLASAKDDLKKIQDQMGALGGKPEDLVAQVKKSADDLAKAQAEVAEKDQVIAGLTQKVKTDDGLVQTEKQQLKRYTDGIAQNSITGRITAVNPGWNFVVLNVGDKQGATVNTPMIIVRNGQSIGKVKITSVEPSTSIADVIPGSMARGDSVQPGDEVVFQKGRAAAPAAGAPGQPAAGGSQSANNSASLPQ